MALPRVLLADDHTLVIEALCKLLEPHFNIVGAVADGMSLVQTASVLEPEVVVVDIAMPLLNGLEAGRQIKTMMPAVKLVFMTMNEDPELAIEAMRKKASGYLLKSSAASELFQAIQVALKGGTYVTPRIAKGMQEAFIRDPQLETHDKRVTPRQREVIQLLAEGKSMKEAGAILKITPRTIAFHKYKVMEHLGIKSNANLLQFALSDHILIGQRHRTRELDFIHHESRGRVSDIQWKARREAAVQLEHLWDKIAKKYDMATLCGYVLKGFQREQESNIYEKICAEHSAVHFQ